jgi:microcystin-dependent protein
MSEPFIAEIKIFAGNFAPRGYAFCDGQLLQISQNTALFSLVGTTYGGDGRTTLGLPNLQGRAPMGARNGPGLTPRSLGQWGGVEQVTLSEAQMASHAHALRAGGPTNRSDPQNALFGTTENPAYGATANLVAMDGAAIGSTGGGQPHANMQPFLVLNFIIALTGVYPSRS